MFDHRTRDALGRYRPRRLLKWGVLALLPLVFFAVTRDTLRLNPAQQAATPYLYDLVFWQATNFFDKWYHLAANALPWRSISVEDRRLKLDAYFQAVEKLSGIDEELKRVEREGVEVQEAVARLEESADEARETLVRLRDDVEETLESTISSVVGEEGIGFWGFLFPPVDVRLTNTPKLLVTSPRDRILRTHDVLLEPDLEVGERDQIEEELLEGSNLSAVVLDIGGLATYPASIPIGRDLERTLDIAAHEWLHHFFFFKSLGQNMFKSDDMQVLNETAAGVIGREIGLRALAKLDGTPRDAPGDGERNPDEGAKDRDDGFDFAEEMQQTRLRVDVLLAEGKIEEAEVYMEERRVMFEDHGFHIRKLNQAYFAFHGTYAESPTSVSPIGDQLHEMNKLVPDLGDFIDIVSGISSYAEFLDKLADLNARASP